VEDVEHPPANLVIEIPEDKHTNYAGQRAEQGERGMAFELCQYRRESSCHPCFVLKIYVRIRPLNAEQPKDSKLATKLQVFS
jgi:hypothetical protein